MLTEIMRNAMQDEFAGKLWLSDNKTGVILIVSRWRLCESIQQDSHRPRVGVALLKIAADSVYLKGCSKKRKSLGPAGRAVDRSV